MGARALRRLPDRRTPTPDPPFRRAPTSDDEVQPNGYAWGGSNYTNYCNEEFDAIMAKAQVDLRPGRRAGIYAQAQDIFLEDVPIMINYIGADRVLRGSPISRA